MDSLRPDHLGCYGYSRAQTPHIDALAGEGILFADCIAQAPYTHISVPSMITGKYPAHLLFSLPGGISLLLNCRHNVGALRQ
ncbi:sulfatase-like hydrolase/transferase [Candidatus Zixiibacteriota bacterium]